MSIVFHRNTRTGPVPAKGRHLDLLGSMEETAKALLIMIELERLGAYDGMGNTFWTGSDSVMNTAKKLVELANERATEARDAGLAP